MGDFVERDCEIDWFVSDAFNAFCDECCGANAVGVGVVDDSHNVGEGNIFEKVVNAFKQYFVGDFVHG